MSAGCPPDGLTKDATSTMPMEAVISAISSRTRRLSPSNHVSRLVLPLDTSLQAWSTVLNASAVAESPMEEHSLQAIPTAMCLVEETPRRYAVPV